MKHEIVLNNEYVKFTDRDLLGQGGEGSVFAYKDWAVKLYHNTTDFQPRKIEELQKIRGNRVIKPVHVAYSKDNRVVGYAMKRLVDAEELCLFFASTHKTDRKIGPHETVDIAMSLYGCVEDVHQFDDYLIVDLNEMNAMVKGTEVFLIDVDSFKTPSFPQTAIMESIRDPYSLGGNFSQETDWYSWAILAYQLYIRKHPFKGKHGKYKPREWRERMIAGDSDFSNGNTLPSQCNPHTAIPKPHRVWMEGVFANKERSKPPVADASATLQIKPAVVLDANKRFEVTPFDEVKQDFASVHSWHGKIYYVSANSICCFDDQGNPVRASRNEEGFKHGFARHGNFYAVRGAKLQQIAYKVFGGKTLEDKNTLAAIYENSTRVFKGCLLHYPLGKPWIVNPYEESKCTNIPVPELEGYKIIDGKAEGNFVVFTGSKEGKYFRFLLQAKDARHSSYRVLAQPIDYQGINMCAVKDLCLVLDGQSLLAFRDINTINQIPDPPFDSTMPLVVHDDKVLFTSGRKVFQLKLR